MFTGIVEDIGRVVSLNRKGENLEIEVKSAITNELKIDQSVSHNGVCLTVVDISNDAYKVVAIKETLEKSAIGELRVNDLVNLERSLKLGDRLDGHIVQGHVDQTGVCKDIKEANGSWYFTFEYDSEPGNITIEKGSITVNGVSLTVVNSSKNSFSVAVIPYTFNNTNFNTIKPSSKVNLEFDVVGKYLKRLYLE